MKKNIFLILLGICIGFYIFTPEDDQLDIAYHTKVESYHPKLAKFLITTKVGRKVSYLFIKKTVKKKKRAIKKELKPYLREIGI